MQSRIFNKACFLLLVTVVLHSAPGHSRSFKVSQSSHPLDEYAIGVLRIATQYMEGSNTLEIETVTATQQRVFEDMAAGRFDIYWAATRPDLERSYSPVRFPIMKGLLGHRIMIIHPGRQIYFNQVQSLPDLQALVLGQGVGWPDVTILRSNGLKVVTTSKYQNLFFMTDGQRFDGFPRGVLEPWTELAAHPQLDLTVEKNIVLVYTLPFYFFVRQEDPALAAQLHTALDRALEAGAFDEFFYNHTMVKDALEKSNLKNRKRFVLQVPDLPPQTPLHKPEYWLDVDAL